MLVEPTRVCFLTLECRKDTAKIYDQFCLDYPEGKSQHENVERTLIRLTGWFSREEAIAKIIGYFGSSGIVGGWSCVEIRNKTLHAFNKFLLIKALALGLGH